MNLNISPPRPKVTQPTRTCQFVFGLWTHSDAPPTRYQDKIVPDAIRAKPMVEKLGAQVYAVGDQAVRDLSPLYGDRLTILRPAEGQLWLTKLRIIEDALSRWSDVVWLDFDARQLREVPADFWDVLKAGPPIQTRIRQYHRRKCHWRPSHPRTLCGGAFIYCREVALVRRAMEVMSQFRHHNYDDEQSMAYVIDELEGGWKGLEHYHAKYDPPWYTIKGEIFPCDNPVFTAS